MKFWKSLKPQTSFSILELSHKHYLQESQRGDKPCLTAQWLKNLSALLLPWVRRSPSAPMAKFGTVFSTVLALFQQCICGVTPASVRTPEFPWIGSSLSSLGGCLRTHMVCALLCSCSLTHPALQSSLSPGTGATARAGLREPALHPLGTRSFGSTTFVLQGRIMYLNQPSPSLAWVSSWQFFKFYELFLGAG